MRASRHPTPLILQSLPQSPCLVTVLQHAASVPPCVACSVPPGLGVQVAHKRGDLICMALGDVCLVISITLGQPSLPHQRRQQEKIKTETEGNASNKVCIVKRITTVTTG